MAKVKKKFKRRKRKIKKKDWLKLAILNVPEGKLGCVTHTPVRVD